MIVAQSPVAQFMSEALPIETSEHSVVLREVTWEVYQSLRSEEGNNHLRMTYDRGELEIMSPSRKHEQISELTSLMICQWALVRRVEFALGGNTTFSRKDLARGLEPDHCYWIAHQAAVRGKDTIDLGVDPPPDLALEIEITRSSVSKLPIYQVLGIPEVWRFRRDVWEILKLNAARQYESQEESSVIPGFPLRFVEELLAQRGIESDYSLIQRFVAAITEPRPS